jgi:hypothetical protein
MTLAGWAALVVLVLLEFLCVPLVEYHLMSAHVGMVCVVLICICGLWFFPYLAPVRLTRPALKTHDTGA